MALLTRNTLFIYQPSLINKVIPTQCNHYLRCPFCIYFIYLALSLVWLLPLASYSCSFRAAISKILLTSRHISRRIDSSPQLSHTHVIALLYAIDILSIHWAHIQKSPIPLQVPNRLGRGTSAPRRTRCFGSSRYKARIRLAVILLLVNSFVFLLIFSFFLRSPTLSEKTVIPLSPGTSPNT